MTIQSDELKRTDFINWLKAKQPDEIVGHTAMACECPIARWLTDVFGGQFGVTRNYYSHYSEETVRRPNTEWMTTFVFKLDMTYSGPVAREQALELINRIGD